MKRISLVITVALIFVLMQSSCLKDDLYEGDFSGRSIRLTTLPASEITSTSAISGGEIIDPGSTRIHSKGIVWSTKSHPTIQIKSGITNEGGGMEDFVSILTGIEPATRYYVRAYARNSAGIVYGTQQTFTTLPASTPIYPSGYVHCDPANPTAVVEVINPTTGKTWMDRNLGAAQAATSLTDAASYGDLYQWGRFADGHQCRTSATTTTLSTTDQPGHGNFILAPNNPFDWRSSQNPNLWQGIDGVNNPCPTGYRLPTEAELNAERQSWSSNNAAGAFSSPLRLPAAGLRSSYNGTLNDVGDHGVYWSSTALLNYNFSYRLAFHSTNAAILDLSRGIGASVRCLKDN
jgi:hypothetical protein